MPHTIRLRGPWQLNTVESETTVTQPIDQTQVAPINGPFSLQRSFNTPTGLVPTTRIDLVIGSVDRSARITLNEETLSDPAAGSTEWRADISRQLQNRNSLSIAYANTPNDSNGDAILLDDVRLEIHDD